MKYVVLFLMWLSIPLTYADSPLIIDLGTGVLRAGLADADNPIELDSRGFMEHGVITDWDAFEKTIMQMYDDLGLDAAEHNVLIADAAFFTRENRVRMSTIMFNTFSVPCMQMVKRELLPFLLEKRATVTLVYIGNDITYVVPFYEGIAIEDAILKIDVGQDDFQGNMEALFDPNLIGHKASGIHKMITESIMSTDSEKHSELFANILLGGDIAPYPDLSDRLEKDITSLSKAKVSVSKLANPTLSVWLGGKLLLDMPAGLLCASKKDFASEERKITSVFLWFY